MRQVTVIAPPAYMVTITGMSRIDVSARMITAYGMDPTRGPIYKLRRNQRQPADLPQWSFIKLAEYVREHAEKLS